MLEPVTLRADYGGRRERRRRGLKDKKKGTEESETREDERQSKEEPGTKLGDPGVSSSGWAVPGLDQMPTKHPKSLLAHFRAISADAAARSMVASKPSIEKAGMGPDPATEEGAPWESTKSDKDDRVVGPSVLGRRELRPSKFHPQCSVTAAWQPGRCCAQGL